MLFYTEDMRKSDFLKTTITNWLTGARKGLLGLEWLPEDNMALKRIFEADGCLDRLIVAGTGFDQKFRDNFGVLGPFEKVPIFWAEWRPGLGLGVQNDYVDIALCNTKAAQDLSPWALDQVVRETFRVLKPGGQFLLLQPVGDDLPESTAALFETKRTAALEGGNVNWEGEVEIGMRAIQLICRDAPEVPVKKARRRRRAKPGEDSR